MYNKNSIVIYVLKLESNKYYIGKTTKICESIDFETIMQILPIKTENIWYNMYKPIKLIEYISDAMPFDMIKYILSYMAKYGIDNVRGGCFSDTILSYTDYIVLSKMIRESYNHCLYCNSETHTYLECKYISNILNSIEKDDNQKNEKNDYTEQENKYNKENALFDTEDFTIITKDDVPHTVES